MNPENMSLYERWQTVVLRSDDQGNSWRRVKEGFMLPAESLAWSLKPYFHGSDEVWATGMPDQPVENDEASLGLYYSADRGATTEAVKLGGPLLVNLAFARTQAPADASFGDYNGNEGRWVSHIVQSDASHARIWVSQSFLYGPADGPYLNTPLWFTFVADLLRENGHWQMQPPKRIDGLYIDQLQDNGAGRVIAVISQKGENTEKVAELSADGLHWKVTGELPSPFSPLRANTGLGDFKVGRNVLLANTTSDYQAPRWLSHGSEPATISADSVYYSTDWGASWSRLAIGGYLGMLGFDGATDRVFWAQGNWYESHDLAVYSDQLH
ncbi:MAG: hypothetical protein GAK45_01849 [Pseudomonas citronellolis]|nr:MAG: hypothetical protein GAK45_01849 [Pseudomonas citronellolis]